jgi:very-short-patch-repair endonuclease
MKNPKLISLNTVRSKSQEERIKIIIKNCRVVHSDTYDYSLIKEYTNDKTKLPIICKKHGVFYQNYNEHVLGRSGCPICKDKRKILLAHNEEVRKEHEKDFFKKVKEIYNDFYDFSEFEYITTNTPSKVICPLHGEFYKCPNKLLNRRQACPNCMKKKLSKREKAVQDFLSENSINFTTNKDNLFEGCISENGNYLDFDFYLPDLNILIEVDGEQHFRPKFNHEIDELRRVHSCDLTRNKWAFEHEIIFIRFSYNITFNNLEKALEQIIINHDYNITNKKIYISTPDGIIDNGYYDILDSNIEK